MSIGQSPVEAFGILLELTPDVVLEEVLADLDTELLIAEQVVILVEEVDLI